MANHMGSRSNVLPAVAAAALGLFLLQCGSFISPAAAKPASSSLSTIGYEEQKNYYSSPDPSTGGTPPSGSSGGSVSTPRGSSPPTGGYHGGSGGTPRPSHHQHTTSPSPPTSCSNPPRDPGVPSTTPTTPSPTYSYPPPPYVGTVTPTVPVVPTSPTPTIVPTLPTPPTPITADPGTPALPTPPFYLDPNNNPFIGTYNYWLAHPNIVFNIFGFWMPLGAAFGMNGNNVPGFPANYSLMQALSNTRGDGMGALYREGTAALLNSIVNGRFPFTTSQVRQRFVSSLGSAGAAGAQARMFKMANEGHMKPRA